MRRIVCLVLLAYGIAFAERAIAKAGIDFDRDSTFVRVPRGQGARRQRRVNVNGKEKTVLPID